MVYKLDFLLPPEHHYEVIPVTPGKFRIDRTPSWNFVAFVCSLIFVVLLRAGPPLCSSSIRSCLALLFPSCN
jgi:hypothetical protein